MHPVPVLWCTMSIEIDISTYSDNRCALINVKDVLCINIGPKATFLQILLNTIGAQDYIMFRSQQGALVERVDETSRTCRADVFLGVSRDSQWTIDHSRDPGPVRT